ncbi:MAG: hypothetical protein HYT87_18990 [Nitrospirae bacterium]|nr:hypothetical protein [Nitrospirota bacterium]
MEWSALIVLIVIVVWVILKYEEEKQRQSTAAMIAGSAVGGRFDETEFHGRYSGGHSSYPKEEIAVLVVGERGIALTGYQLAEIFAEASLRQGYRQISIKIPYDSVADYGIATRSQIEAGKVLLLGVVGLLLQKNKPFLYIRYTDEKGIDQTPAFYFQDETGLQKCMTLIEERVRGKEPVKEVRKDGSHTRPMVCGVCGSRPEVVYCSKCGRGV